MSDFLKSLSIPVILATLFALAAIVVGIFFTEFAVLAIVLALLSIASSLISYREMM